MRHHLELSTRAQKDLRRIDRSIRRRLADAIDRLADIPPAPNLDVETVTGHEPFRRMRVGEWRVIYRPLLDREVDGLVLRYGTLESRSGFLVARIVNRRDLERAVATLELVEL